MPDPLPYRNRPPFLLPILFSYLFFTSIANAQEGLKPTFRAVPLGDRTITLDGTLDEPIWREAPAATGFIQQRPDTGLPARGESFIRTVYDEVNLYIGAELHDPDPEQVRADERRRDGSFDRSDSFAVVIDTYHDHQNGFFFETNLLGARSDALVTREGSDVDANWDGLWEAAARRTETGWSVEIRIPFATLRFRSGGPQTWGIQFRRRIPHLKENSYWSPLTPEQSLYELSRAGHLLGVGAGQRERRLGIKPYAKARISTAGPTSGTAGTPTMTPGSTSSTGFRPTLPWT
jgi:hypothetical protein